MSSGGLDFPALSSAPSPSRKEQQQRKAAAADVVPAAAAASASHSPKTPTKRQQQQQQHQQHHPHSPQRHAPAAGGSPRTPDRRALSHSNSSSNSHGSAASHSSSGAAKARPAASPHKTSGGAQLDDFDQFFVGTASLIHDIDKRVLVVLREPGVPTGTKYFGVLRSFDQFSNLVLQDCVEREYVGQEYAEKQRGLFIVRGENVVFISQLDADKAEVDSRLTRIEWPALMAKRTAALAQQGTSADADPLAED